MNVELKTRPLDFPFGFAQGRARGDNRKRKIIYMHFCLDAKVPKNQG